MNKFPEIRIKDAWLLRESASVPLHKLWGKGKRLAGDDDMKRIVASYQKAWEPYESEILRGMTGLLGLQFYQNVIDVYIAPWFYAFSDPMVIGVVHDPDFFIDILTHELLHRLLTDNTTLPYGTKILGQWQTLFGKQYSFKALIHIPVHAVLKAVYLDVLKDPKRLQRDIAQKSKDKATAYIKAWDYVEKHDYEKIIEDLKQMYERLGKEV